jgi:hypothetical protein
MSDLLDKTANKRQNLDSTFKVNPFPSRSFGVQSKSEESTPASKAELWENYQQAKQLNQGINQSSIPIQAKLTVGQPGDKYEQEADHTAQQVMEIGDNTLQREITIQSDDCNLRQKPEQPKKGDANTIVAGQPFDQETQQEIDIAKSSASAVTRAQGYLTRHMLEVMSATNAFKDSARNQIDVLDGDPSDYWALLPALAGAIGAAMTVWIPGANIAIGAAIAVAVQAAIQTTAVAEVKGSRSDMKKQANAAMNQFAQNVDIGQAKAINQIGKQISQTMLTLSVTNDDVRMELIGGSDEALERVVETYLGITNPAKKSPYGEVIKNLSVEFAGWITRQQLNSDRTGVEKMIGETEGTDQYKEDRIKIEAAKKAAEEQANETAKKRGN